MSRKARQMLDTMIAEGTVNRKAVDWLTTASDPFHDVAIEPAGYPDINTVSTLTQMFTYTTAVSTPTPLTNATWDCHVFFAPYAPDVMSGIENRLALCNFNASLQRIDDGSLNPSYTMGPGYNAVATPTGSPYYGGTASAFPQIELDATIQGGCYRLVAAGVEVVNTTPELYKSGSVTYYRSPSHSVIATPTSGTQNWPITVATFAIPPSSQNQAQLYPTSRTMQAAEGYYGIATLNADPSFQSAIGIAILGIQAPDLVQIDSNVTQPCFINTGMPNPTAPRTGTGRVLPFDTHGAIFSGMSAQTTLQITTRYYVERIPSANDANLLVLTRPPTPYDPTVLEIYSRILSQLPIGCTVAENPLGEWFNDVLEAVAMYAPAVGSAFGGLGTVFGQGIGAGANTWLKSRAKQEKPSQQVLKAKPTPKPQAAKRRKPPRRRPQMGPKQLKKN